MASKLLELAQAVREQHVRQLLPSKARHRFWVLELQLHLWTGWPANGRSCASVRILLAGLWCCKQVWTCCPGAREDRTERLLPKYYIKIVYFSISVLFRKISNVLRDSGVVCGF